ncbi:protein translocase subunit SecF [Ammonicoccus fulvus]|uniref:Protein-export membrane protein SecF n=1 Tax=Ammonicoccus fulvus TaxID=3138240 RepID=A0ABZ3FP42_9ACTN
MSSSTNTSDKSKSSLAHRLYVGELSFDFVGRRKTWYVMSGIIIAIALIALLVRGLSLGIEFSGGADFQAPTRVTAQTVDNMRAAVAASGVPDLDDATVTTIGDNTVRVQTRSLDAETEVPLMREVIAKELGVGTDEVAYSLIGASWGKQITQQGLIALVVFLVLVMVMIWIYFRDLKMSIAAIVAVLHDLLLTIGIYALVGFTFTPATLIGMLTILGYSLYDTVVVFDKVRENTANLRSGRVRYAALANKAVNQVLIRSINTTIIGVLPVAALLVAGWFILGTGPLKDLGLVLFVGMVAGAYSSVLIATPLLVDMKMREPDIIAHEESLTRRAQRKGPRKSADEVDDVELDEDVSEPTNEELAASPSGLRITTDEAKVWRPDAGERIQPKHRTRSERKK